MVKPPPLSDVIIVVLSTLAFWVLAHGQPVRSVDEIVVNYLLDPGPLALDRIFFSPAYHQPFNPYFFQHHAIAGLVGVTGWSVHAVAEIFQLVAFAIAASAVVYLVDAVTHSAWAKICVAVLMMLNLNLVNIGATDFVIWGYAPQNLAIGPALFAIAAFVRGRHGVAMLLAALTLWIHLPTAIYVTLPLGLAMIFDRGPIHFARRHWVAFLFSVAIVIPFLVLAAQLMSAANPIPVPAWVDELDKQITYNHISLYYRLRHWGWAFNAVTLAGVAAINALSFVSWRRKAAEDDAKMASWRRMWMFVVAATACLIVDVVAVDVFDLAILYPFALLRIMLFPAILLLVQLATEMPRLRGVARGEIRAVHIVWLCGVILLAPNLYLRRHDIAMALAPVPAMDRAWASISKATNQLPPDSRVLVPYDRADFYRYSRRLSPFNYTYLGFLLSDSESFDEINKRMNDFVSPNFLELSTRRLRENPRDIEAVYHLGAAWTALDTAKLERLRSLYGITHIIAETGRRFPGTVIDRNEFYELIELK